MGISFSPTMTREMFATGRHARRVHATDESPCQGRGALRVTFKGTTANHRTTLVIQVQHRGKAQVQTHRQHFSGHQPTALLGEVLGVIVIGNRPHRWQAHEALTQALHPAALLVHRQDQVRANGVDRGRQLTHLAWAFDIAGKDDQAGHFGLAQKLAIFGGQPGTGDVHHQGALQAGTHN
ncbi:hypothetical protein D3C78_908590 [compost metagenome]